jgi:hypothetical protein
LGYQRSQHLDVFAESGNTGNVAKYHPMNEEAKQEYAEWLKQLKKSEEV